MIVGVTGHSGLSDASIEPIHLAIHDALRPYADGNLTGITCLARGADQVFARAVLDLGEKIEVVIPAADYADRIPDPDSRARFDKFIADASAVHQMPYATSGPEAYLAASKDVIQRCELLLAVWDGGPADGRGGTADAVDYARAQQRNMVVVWPAIAHRV